MSNVYLCTGKRTKNPFYIKFSDFSLYSIEELCYYFIERIYVTNDELKSQELSDWIRNECGLPELSDILDEYLKKGISLPTFVSTILEYVGLYDITTVKKVEQVLKDQETLSPFEKSKQMADYYFQTGRFRQAMGLYTAMLEHTGKQETSKKATLCYDIAAVYAMDFCYEEAARFYKQSYDLQSSPRTRRGYILASRMALSDFEYGEFKRQHSSWGDDFETVEDMYSTAAREWQQSRAKGMLEDIYEHRQKGEVEEFYKGQAQFIGRLKGDYRRQTS